MTNFLRVGADGADQRATPGEAKSHGPFRLFTLAFLLLVATFGTTASAQESGRRTPARSLTSEDLLNRPVIYIPQPATAANSHPASSGAVRNSSNAGSTSYRDPSGAFTLTFPNGNWRVNMRAASAGRIYNQRSFRRIEDEGFASATANVYVLTDRPNLPVVDPAHMSEEAQRELASMLAARFFSNNASLVAIEPVFSNTRSGFLRIIADQVIARRVAVRAAINVFERQGRLYVVVCCASPETFDASAREFDAITNSLASSVMRS